MISLMIAFILANISPETAAPAEMIPSYEGAFLKMFLTLLALVIGIFLMIWTLRRMAQGKWGKSGNGRTIKIVGRQPLSQKTMLYIIDVDGKQTLIAESQLEVKPIMTLENAVSKPQEP